MALRMPESMDECIYFTRRKNGKGSIIAWVYRPACSKCTAGKVGKPIDAKTGKVKTRSESYECSHCHAEFSKSETEQGLMVEIVYACPYCGNSGEATTEYKRKSWEGVPAYVFTCGSCGKKLGITKKMKAPKKKGEPSADDA